ncbi:hypothetical protein H0H81_000823 [Sphagnurus paluster]|uniref:Uncharacterized protein n=1 Tax=Sphagnurus paluster TaxID=117069 RepID=A0A9P7FXS1_9AGAR|nr:hypothetical protein H0H81_000823 [Sphagnurus paluster]
MSATPANMRFVTWIGMSCSPTTYQVPDTTQYQIYRGHTLVVDISASKNESLEVFLKCLERVALADGHGLPHIENLMIRLTHPDVHLESGLSQPHRANAAGSSQRSFWRKNVVDDFGGYRMHELFSHAKTLNIQHPSALETFAAMCEDIPTLYTQLEV